MDLDGMQTRLAVEQRRGADPEAVGSPASLERDDSIAARPFRSVSMPATNRPKVEQVTLAVVDDFYSADIGTDDPGIRRGASDESR